MTSERRTGRFWTVTSVLGFSNANNQASLRKEEHGRGTSLTVKWSDFGYNVGERGLDLLVKYTMQFKESPLNMSPDVCEDKDALAVIESVSLVEEWSDQDALAETREEEAPSGNNSKGQLFSDNRSTGEYQPPTQRGPGIPRTGQTELGTGLPPWRYVRMLHASNDTLNQNKRQMPRWRTATVCFVGVTSPLDKADEKLVLEPSGTHGDFGISAVGMSCSPGLVQRIGPSLLIFLEAILTEDNSPHGITSGGKLRKAQSVWFRTHSWLRYSMSKLRFFCAPCFLFGDQVARSKALTREPFTDWCNFSKIVERHSKSQCHIDQLIAAENYLAVLKGQKKDIECTISQFNAMVEKNRQILVSIVETIILCGQQNIALRGHDESSSNFQAPTVVTTLDRLADEGDRRLRYINFTNFEFIVTLVAIEHLLSALVPLSNMLQAKDCDLLHAANDTRGVMVLLQAERNDDEVWISLFQKAVDIAGDVNVIPAAPRRYGRQQNRPNAPGNTSEFWKRNMYLPFVDHLLVELEKRLMQGHGRFCAPKLLPLKIQNDGLPRESINDVYQAFHACIDVDETIFVRECERWRMWWTDAALAVDRPAAPASLAESITLASKALYPSIRHCLTLLMVMPVSTATVERSFSVMRRVKTYLRSTMGTERLSGLGRMNVYKDREISAERFVDKFANQQNRRLAFVFKV
ncbi:LOW QUALITY PROTEIN: P52K-like protein [Mya arenaria]|uniref:P52K-like protein n=1 Tax=Mya arenaria TaxID=6604 RepID=A0ABY7FZE7_MYAAR|nr:LOW QUALITY PROTEIN: P52K-like protein [Mya arenaria]